MCSLFVFFIFNCVFISPSYGRTAINDRPIIGILTEEVNSPFAPNGTSYIMASYVKYLESGGARIVPIMIHKSREYYQNLMSKINGVLFPGGANDLQNSGYGKAGKIIFDIATKMNDKGDYFPLWGTCLGFELLNFIVAKKNWMKACSANDMPSNINFTEVSFMKSRMFNGLESSLKKVMQNQNVTIHYHQWCVTLTNYSNSHLDEYFQVLATNKDSNGLTFVSTIEAHKYPFYGTAYHPEKVRYEWVLSKTHHNIPHSSEAVKASQYFANFFVDEARKSSHHFPSKEEEDAVLIYNYNPVFTGKIKNYASIQNYYFD